MTVFVVQRRLIGADIWDDRSIQRTASAAIARAQELSEIRENSGAAFRVIERVISERPIWATVPNIVNEAMARTARRIAVEEEAAIMPACARDQRIGYVR